MILFLGFTLGIVYFASWTKAVLVIFASSWTCLLEVVTRQYNMTHKQTMG